MEEWKEVFAGMIPAEHYQTKLTNGEDNGLVIELISDSKRIIIRFGIVQAVRMLDEGIVQKELFSDKQVEKYKSNGFKNVIYEVTGGQFAKQIQNISDGYLATLEMKHYVIITMNYNMDIITEYEPEIELI